MHCTATRELRPVSFHIDLSYNNQINEKMHDNATPFEQSLSMRNSDDGEHTIPTSKVTVRQTRPDLSLPGFSVNISRLYWPFCRHNGQSQLLLLTLCPFSFACSRSYQVLLRCTALVVVVFLFFSVAV